MKTAILGFGTVGVGVYVLGSLLLKVDSFRSLLDLVRRKSGPSSEH